jgi:hypothetical protein
MKEIRGNRRRRFLRRVIIASTVATSLLLMVNFLGCETLKCSPSRTGKMKTSKTIEEVLKTHTKYLMSIPGVVGTGEGSCEGRPCIKVYVRQITPQLSEQIPKALEGYMVVPVETGEFEAFPEKGSD